MSAVDDATAFLAGDSRDIGRQVLAMAAELDRLRLAARAMEGLAPDVLAAVTPDALRAVLAARGWHVAAGWSTSDEYDHETAIRGAYNAFPAVHDTQGFRGYGDRVRECVAIIASRHGESAAEVLAEVLREQSSATVKIPASGA